MENHFKFEIIGPEKIIFSNKVKMVTLPSYEGEMGVLKNSIPDFIMKDSELASVVNNLSKADINDGGDGAIYINLKKL